jgi:hypothetical protein
LAKLVAYFAQQRIYADEETQHLVTDGVEGSGIGANYERMIDKYLEDDRLRWTHFLSIEDDMGFAPDVLHLLASRRLDIVGANYSVNKGSPLRFTAQKGGKTVLTTEESTGVEEVDLLPQGLTLVRREVYETIPRPWYCQGWSEENGHVTQDYVFSQRAREAGFSLHVDHDASKKLFHVGPRHYTYRDALADELEKRRTADGCNDQ